MAPGSSSGRPQVYGWPHLLIGNGAGLGIWNADERMIFEGGGARSEHRRAFVLDYGFRPDGGLAEFERLLRLYCTSLQRQGVTELSIFCARGSPAEALIRALADHVVDVEFQCALPEPAGAAESGVYVDHLHF